MSFGGLFTPLLYRFCSAHCVPVETLHGHGTLIYQLPPKHEERFPASFGILLTFRTPTPGCGSVPHPLKARRTLMALCCHPDPALLLGLPSWPWAAPVLLHRAGMVSSGSTIACSAPAAPDTLTGLFSLLCLAPLQAELPPALQNVLSGERLMSSAGRGPQLRSHGVVGPCCEELGVCQGALEMSR